MLSDPGIASINIDPTLTAGRPQFNRAGRLGVRKNAATFGHSVTGASPELDRAVTMFRVATRLPKDDLATMSYDQRPFTLGLIQMRCSSDREDNLGRACAMLRQAADRGAQIACLPELFRTQYFCQVEEAGRFELAEPVPGPTTSSLSALARETRMVVIGSVFERPRARTLPQYGGRDRLGRMPPRTLS